MVATTVAFSPSFVLSLLLSWFAVPRFSTVTSAATLKQSGQGSSIYKKHGENGGRAKIKRRCCLLERLQNDAVAGVALPATSTSPSVLLLRVLLETALLLLHPRKFLLRIGLSCFWVEEHRILAQLLLLLLIIPSGLLAHGDHRSIIWRWWPLVCMIVALRCVGSYFLEFLSLYLQCYKIIRAGHMEATA